MDLCTLQKISRVVGVYISKSRFSPLSVNSKSFTNLNTAEAIKWASVKWLDRIRSSVKRKISQTAYEKSSLSM